MKSITTILVAILFISSFIYISAEENQNILKAQYDLEENISSLSVSPNGKYIAVGTDKGVYLFNSNGEMQWKDQSVGKVYSSFFTYDSKYLVVVKDNYVPFIYNEKVALPNHKPPEYIYAYSVSTIDKNYKIGNNYQNYVSASVSTEEYCDIFEDGTNKYNYCKFDPTLYIDGNRYDFPEEWIFWYCDSYACYLNLDKVFGYDGPLFKNMNTYIDGNIVPSVRTLRKASVYIQQKNLASILSDKSTKYSLEKDQLVYEVYGIGNKVVLLTSKGFVYVDTKDGTIDTYETNKKLNVYASAASNNIVLVSTSQGTYLLDEKGLVTTSPQAGNYLEIGNNTAIGATKSGTVYFYDVSVKNNTLTQNLETLDKSDTNNSKDDLNVSQTKQESNASIITTIEDSNAQTLTGNLPIILAALGIIVIIGILLFLKNKKATPIEKSKIESQPEEKTKKCPSCGKSVNSDWVKCPECWADLKNK